MKKLKFKTYLREEEGINPLVKEEIMTQVEFDNFLKACKPFLDEVGKMSYPTKPLYRGVSRYAGMNKWMVKQSHIEKRLPMNTEESIHLALNKAFEEEFGWKVRNGVFASGEKKDIKRYGHVWYFIPIGELDFVWSEKVDDLFISDSYTPFSSAYHLKDNDKMNDEAKKLMKLYTDEDLEASIKSGHEIMFNCDRYYIFDADYVDWSDIVE
jgi:hypothetical protein